MKEQKADRRTVADQGHVLQRTTVSLHSLHSLAHEVLVCIFVQSIHN